MYCKALLAALAYAATASAQAFSVNTPPSLVQCEPVSLSWTGGSTAPYNIAAIPGGQPSAPAIVNIASTQSSPYAWTVNVASGTSVTIKVTDAQGNIAYSSQLTVQSGPSNSCLSASASSGGSATSAGSSASAGGASASGAATGAATSSKSGSASASASTGASASGSAAAASTSKAAAGRSAVLGGALGVAGLMAAVVAA